MKLYIKNMVCPRCVMAVEHILQLLDIGAVDIKLGEAELSTEIDKQQLDLLRCELNKLGFELLDDERQRLIEQIKSIVIRKIHYSDSNSIPLSNILAAELHRDYSYLSKLFSTTECITIEQFVIFQKIERAKELLSYNQQTLSQIADTLSYSSVAHLSAQFKKVTGLTPTQFKQQGIVHRRGLDTIGQPE